MDLKILKNRENNKGITMIALIITIKVLTNVSDTSGVISVNKTITIDTNGYTLTRDDEMKITEKTLTINGGGTINCVEDKSTFRTYDGNISVSSVTIMGDSYGINTAANTSGTITVNDSYIYIVQGVL